MPQEEEDALAREGQERNQLAWKDVAWCTVHLGCIAMDAAAFQQIMDWQTEASAFLGGHAQFLALWSIAASLAGHISNLHAMLSFEPYPETYLHRERLRRDKVYSLTARLTGLSTTFCTASSIIHLVLHLLGDREWRMDSISSRIGWFAPVHVMVLISLDKWICLLFQVPRHWSFGPARYISRRSRFMEIQVGQTGLHKAVSAYFAWLLACRICNGRWAYSILRVLESGSGTGVNHVLQIFLLFLNLHMVAWLCWRCCAAVAPKPRLL
jgi:hypothetical protein